MKVHVFKEEDHTDAYEAEMAVPSLLLRCHYVLHRCIG